MTLHYRKNSRRVQCAISSQQIIASNSFINRGVCCNNTVSYEIHIRNTAIKASRLIVLLFKIFSTREAYSLSKLEFCDLSEVDS